MVNYRANRQSSNPDSNQILNSTDNIPYLWYRLSGDASLPDLCDYELVQNDVVPPQNSYSNIFTWTFDVTFPSLDTTTGVNNNPNLKPINKWRSHAHLLFGNWINQIYQESPYDINQINSSSI